MWTCLMFLLFLLICPPFLFLPTLHLPFISWSLIGFANCKLNSYLATNLTIPNHRLSFLRFSIYLTQTFNVIMNKALILTFMRIQLPKIADATGTLVCWRAAVIKVQVWEIIHHEMVAVDNLHDRGIQNDVARLGIVQPHLPINQTHTHTCMHRELGNDCSQHVVYPSGSITCVLAICWPTWF